MNKMRDIKECVKGSLVVGKQYRINIRCITDGRIRDEKYQTSNMICKKLYENFAMFEDEHGQHECFLYQDLYKMLFGMEGNGNGDGQ